MIIEELPEDRENDWIEYVLNHPKSTVQHHPGWGKSVQQTYGHQPITLIATKNEVITGIFPLILMKGLLFRKKLISVPFGAYGGVIANDHSIADKLIEKGKVLFEKHKVKYLEIRGNPIDTSRTFNTSLKIGNHQFVSSIIELPDQYDELWKRLKKNKRKTISKSERQGTTWKWDANVDDFYKIYSKNMHDLGTPVHSKDFFINIQRAFPGSIKIQSVSINGEIIYSSYYIFFKNSVLNCWSSSLPEYRKFYPTDLGIWNVMKSSIEDGYGIYDFGRSIAGSSNQEFKRRWGAEQKPLLYQYHVVKGTMPDYNPIKSSNYKFIKLWKKMPLSITKLLGPKLRKYIP